MATGAATSRLLCLGGRNHILFRRINMTHREVKLVGAKQHGQSEDGNGQRFSHQVENPYVQTRRNARPDFKMAQGPPISSR